MMYEDENTPANKGYEQCNSCKRYFNPTVLTRHAQICQSVAKKRKVFDSSRQRAEGTDIPTLKPMKPKPEPPKKQSNWRKKHDDFIATIRAAKSVAHIIKDGGPLPPPPPPTYDPDYIQCPCCQRRFNENAAERHIKFCQEQAARMPQRGKVADVKKPPARTQYKPPALVKKANPAAAPTVPLASSRLPQRSGLGQPTGIPSSKVSYPASTRTNSPGLTSPASGIGNNSKMMNSGNRAVKSTRSRISLDRKKTDSSMSREDVAENELENGGMKSKFCHGCGSKYPVETAKFCCECGIKRMFI
ncbi:zinc finger C2HC domain-containing protein 1A [Takifugu rubripes]|uniref:zinc finger C2HC domain-containing protein 1A n=1 Tax=Takifugu rubripes TaxID=31033 RepID=UPI0005D21A87|nr:zinc finger C2HC domain-containing protein 1A [Takifugu rubripes]|eukprot:XP_011606143.1 PREDICTED: zinc finger C2HC domain-containing protein 1A [Takifugu rubripes]